MEATIAPPDGYVIANRVLLGAPADEIWRRLTRPEEMQAWMVGVCDAKMHGNAYADGGEPGALVELEGRAGKSGSWVCVGETLEAGRDRLVREYLLTKVWAISVPLPDPTSESKTEHQYRRLVTHQITMLDGVHTELETTVEVNIPGFPKAAVKPARRAEQKALAASHRRLQRLLSGRRSPFSFLTGAWHSPCFL